MDLDEARQLAERAPMRVDLADIHLHHARLSTKRNLNAPALLILQCGYWRRKQELEDAQEPAKNC